MFFSPKACSNLHTETCVAWTNKWWTIHKDWVENHLPWISYVYWTCMCGGCFTLKRISLQLCSMSSLECHFDTCYGLFFFMCVVVCVCLFPRVTTHKRINHWYVVDSFEVKNADSFGFLMLLYSHFIFKNNITYSNIIDHVFNVRNSGGDPTQRVGCLAMVVLISIRDCT